MEVPRGLSAIDVSPLCTQLRRSGHYYIVTRAPEPEAMIGSDIRIVLEVCMEQNSTNRARRAPLVRLRQPAGRTKQDRQSNPGRVALTQLARECFPGLQRQNESPARGLFVRSRGPWLW